MNLGLLVAFLLSVDGGEPVRERTVECTYAGYCCQFDLIGKSGCQFRVFCRGHRVERVQGNVVVDPGICK